MTPELVIDLMNQAFQIALVLALPVMLSTLVVGVTISVFQSITSIQEQTMVFVPKMIAVFVAMLICFSWMLNTVINFTQDLFLQIPDIVK
jgi:flagellar biosynthetic protein FliQ